MPTVLVAGTFDGLHPGHVKFLEFAKRHGDVVVAIVARDKSVERIKGRTPLFTEAERRELAGSLRIVDRAVLGGEGDFLDAVVAANPATVVLGHDQEFGEKRLEEALAKRGVHAKVVRAPQFDRGRFKSSMMKLEGGFAEKL